MLAQGGHQVFGLMFGAIEHRHLRGIHDAALLKQATDLRRYECGLRPFVRRRVEDRGTAGRIVGPHGMAVTELLTDGVRERHELRRRSEVLVQRDNARLGEGAWKLQQESRLATTKAIDRVVDDQALGGVVMQVLDFEVVHRAAVPFPVDRNDFVFDDSVPLQNGHDHRGMQLCRRLERELLRADQRCPQCNFR